MKDFRWSCCHLYPFMDFSRGRDITTIDRVSNNIDRRLSFIPIHFSLHLYLLYECGLNAKSNILIILCLLLSIISPFILNVFFPGRGWTLMDIWKSSFSIIKNRKTIEIKLRYDDMWIRITIEPLPGWPLGLCVGILCSFEEDLV